MRFTTISTIVSRRWKIGAGALIGLASLVVTPLIAHSALPKSSEFDETSIRGSWGFNAAGTIVPPAFPEPVPAVAVGLVRFDGAGGCEFRDTINIAGTVFPDRTSTTCSYSVLPDGRGEISTTFAGEPAPVPLSFVIVDGSREIRFVRTDLGVASGVARRQTRRAGR